MNARKSIAYLGASGLGLWLGSRVYRRLRGYDFRDRSAIVTGGTRGLGLVMARQLVAAGARVAVCARDEGEVRRAQADLTERGGMVLARVCDLRNVADAEEFARQVEREFGRVDVLINNAGIIEVGPEATMTRTDFIDAMATNFWAALYMIQAVLPGMKQRREGRIVNVTSIGGKVSVPHLLPYSASKFALVGLSEGLRSELAREGITVTTVCPGLMRTGSPPNALFKGQHRAEYAWFTLSDSLPGLSMNAERAARKVLNACRRGDSEIVLSLPAKAAVLFHGLFPGLTADLLGLINRLLPGEGGIGTASARGGESESPLTRSVLTSLTAAAARRNNQVPAPRPQPADEPRL